MGQDAGAGSAPMYAFKVEVSLITNANERSATVLNKQNARV
jgi:hypothetical protein